MPKIQHPTIERAVYEVSDSELQAWLDVGYKQLDEDGQLVEPESPGEILTEELGSDNPPAVPGSAGAQSAPAETATAAVDPDTAPVVEPSTTSTRKKV